MRSGTIQRNLLAYSSAHALVDAISAMIVVSSALFVERRPDWVFLLYLIYNFAAFAMQLPLGALLDRLRAPRFFASMGLILLAVACALFEAIPIVGAIVAGLGNAIFHLGGGVVSMNLARGRASYIGIFVAPGALGLFAGALVGAHAPLGAGAKAAAILAALVLALAILALPLPDSYARSVRFENKSGRNFHPVCCAIGLIFLSIAIRSFVGLSLSFPWKEERLFFAFAIAAAAGGGKAIGGLLADRLGFVRVSVAALALSIPLLALGMRSPALGLAGCLCFQMTMPVTLLACASAFPGRDGFAFGLNCLALFVGSLPVFGVLGLPVLSAWREVGGIARSLLIVMSIACLYLGLWAVWGGSRR